MMQRKKILIIAATLEYPIQNGYYMRMLNTTLELGRTGSCQFDFLFYKNNLSARERVIAGLKKYYGIGEMRAVNQSFCSMDQLLDFMEYSELPPQVNTVVAPEMVENLKYMLSKKNYDIVQIEQSFMLWLVPHIREFSDKIKIVYASHQMEWEIWQRRYQFGSESAEVRALQKIMAAKLARWEQEMFVTVDAAFLVADRDQQTFKKHAPDIPAFTIPHTVDMHHYQFKRVANLKYDVVFIGGLNWYPPVHGLKWFVSEVWPILSARASGVKLHIIGSGKPYADMERFLEFQPDVYLWSGQVDEREFFYNAKVFVVPLFIGAGARVKIPVAAACGTPIVATSVGAEGYDWPGYLTVTDDPEEIAASIAEMIKYRDLNERISQMSQMWAGQYELRRIAQLQNSFYNKILD